MAVRSLTVCLRAFQREVHLLASLFESQTNSVGTQGFWTSPPRFAAQSYSIVRLHDSWARFCRTLILTSATGNVSTLSGSHVTRSPAVASGQSSLDALKATYTRNQRRRVLWEPRWYEPTDAIEAAGRLQVHNFSAISAALGAMGTGVGELGDCRHFLAHRSELSNNRVDVIRARLGLPSSASVQEIANSLVPGGVRLYEFWWQELLLRANAAAA